MTLDGEAWKSRGDKTYTSLLDLYGASDLFSEESMDLYHQSEQDKTAEQQELKGYLFSGKMQVQSEDESIVDQIFSEEIQFSRIRDYSRNVNDNSLYFVLAEVLFVLIFIYILMRWNARRRERRKENAVKINI